MHVTAMCAAAYRGQKVLDHLELQAAVSYHEEAEN